MIGRKKKQVKELVTKLEEQTKQIKTVRIPLDYQAEQVQRQLLPMQEYEIAKWGTPDPPTNISEPKTYLTDWQDWQKQLLKDSQQDEFNNNMDKLSKIIEAKKHDEERSVSMARGFKELDEVFPRI